MADPVVTPTPDPLSRPIRVVVQQPALSHYRIPVFRELAKRPGIDLCVVYGDEKGITNVSPDGFRAEFVKLHDIRIGPGLVRWHPAQYRYCTPRHADVVVLSWSTRYLSLVPGLVRARWNDLGVVLWGHGYSKAEKQMRRRSRNALIAFADSVVLYNYTAAQAIIDSGASPPERVFVALNTLDLEPIRAVAASWRKNPEALARFRFENHLDAGPVVLFVSRLFESNRTDLLIRATPELLRHYPALSVVIVGDGPDAPRLKQLAEDLGVAKAVRFVGALYGEEAIAPWFLSADVFCYPTNVGLSLIHAMSYALPIVTGDRQEAQNPEIEALHDGINGLTFKDGDAASLAQSLLMVLRDPAQKRRLGEAAEETVTGDFTIEKMVDGLEAAIRVAAVRHGRYGPNPAVR
ncbi:MAG: hypothetical protein HBSAPP03_09660 [Phycisphaerae bacterium]|nr:MAG: hypothetical protein HBSAPP03_09660 [Phycisphaerae bacterium]